MRAFSNGGATAETSARVAPKADVPQIAPDTLTLCLVERTQETRDIVSFRFAVARSDGSRFRHHPGQAISLTVPMPDGDSIRVFTIAGSNPVDATITLTVKAGPEARATRYLHDQLEVGQTLVGRGPFGNFSIVHHPGKPLFLIGAGSGLTPVISMLRWLSERGEKTDVVFVQQARRPSDLLFQEELAQIDRAMPNLKRFDVVTQVPDGESWSGLRGRLTRASMRLLAPDLGRRTAFCCGPQSFMKAMGAIYRAEGGIPDQFMTEAFGSDHDVRVVEQPPAPLETISKADVPVAALGDHRFSAPPSQTLVTAAAAAGIRIPTACQEGICGTCRLRLVEGQVDMRHQGDCRNAKKRPA